MQVKIQAQILGAKRFKGTVEGTEYDFCKVLVATNMDESKGNAVGLTAAEYKFGTSENFERFKGFKFPLETELLAEMTSNGTVMTMNLIEFRPLNQKTEKA